MGMYFTIKNWADEDRPREKLLLKGKSVLSDAELMAILIGSGTPSVSAVELSRQILSHFKFNLAELARASVKDLMKFKGIGEAKAISIVAALELARRRKDTAEQERPKITQSRDAYHVMQAHLTDLPHEEFWIILLNRANLVLREHLVSSGGISGTVADPKIIFKAALDHRASSLILVHNHPSGNLKPSHADKLLTEKVKKGGELLEIPVLDHIIFTNAGYFSFADQGIL